MIKYLSLKSHYKESVLFRIYEGIKNKIHTVQVVFNSVDDMVYLWQPGFFKEYVGSNIYGVESATFIYEDATLGTFNISSKEDILKKSQEVTLTYQPRYMKFGCEMPKQMQSGLESVVPIQAPTI